METNDCAWCEGSTCEEVCRRADVECPKPSLARDKTPLPWVIKEEKNMVALPRTCERCGNSMYHYGVCFACATGTEPEPPDPRDAEIARLRAKVEAAYREGFRDGLAEAQSDGPWIGENAHWLASHANT